MPLDVRLPAGWRRRHKRGYGVVVEGVRAVLPERIESDGVLLRRWMVDDAQALSGAITESADHLRPWMDWMAHEPKTPEQRRTVLVEWEREWRSGGDVVLGVFVDDQVVGGCGLHRVGASGLEMGYWVRASHVGQGIGTAVARLLTDAAFSVPGVTHVEIHMDKANARSSAIARRLGFRFLRETHDGTDRPIRCAWRMDRAAWPRRVAR
jgi:ribosomal-protein-serine acetyltransferase